MGNIQSKQNERSIRKGEVKGESFIEPTKRIMRSKSVTMEA